jgi:recombination protein RecT
MNEKTDTRSKQLTPAAQFRGELDRMRAQIMAALPKHVDIDKFARVVMTAVQTAPNLLTVDRQSLLRACIEAATDGLIPDGREGAIVPYKGKAQWQPMVWGLVKLVRQSGELETIGTRIVREGDQFDYWIDEGGEHFKHVPHFGGDDRPMRLVYAYARTKDGGVYFEPMDAAEIAKFRALSKAKSDDSPWATWPDEMAKVRPLKRLCKRLPLSVDAIEALERDNLRDAEVLGQGPKENVIDMLNRQIAEPEKPALTDAPSEAFDPMVISNAPRIKPADDPSTGTDDFIAAMEKEERLSQTSKTKDFPNE